MPWLVVLLPLFGCGAAPLSAAPAPVAPAPAPAPIAAPAEPVPLAQLPEDVRPLGYTLTLEVDPRVERFAGEVRIAIELDRSRDVIWLHADRLDVATAMIVPDGATPIPARAERHPTGVLALRAERTIPAGRATIDVRFTGAFDRTLQGLYRVEEQTDAYAFTQLESTYARLMFPCFDEPRFKTPFDLALVVRDEDRAFANTPETSREPAGAGRTRIRFATTLPLPTYLIAIAVGPLDVVDGEPIAPNDVRDRPLPLRGLAPRGQGPRLAHALSHTGPLVAALERYTGLAYPYEKLDVVAVPDFSSGAMENAGLVTFRDTLLLLDEDASEGQLRAFTYVMAHELAHQWFGNLVTMPWWDDLWLNEAFATWLGYRVVGEVHPEQDAGRETLDDTRRAMAADSLESARRIREPIGSHDDIRNAFDAITYEKGAAVLRMFERHVGEARFRDALHRYLTTHAFGTATSGDLLRVLSEVAGQDLAAPMSTFLDRPGLPLVTVTPVCEGGAARHLELAQSRFRPLGSTAPDAHDWSIPVCLRLGDWHGQSRVVCTVLDEPTERLPLEGECPAFVHPNANAAGYYRFALPEQPFAALVRKLPALSDLEQISVADAVAAAFETGTIDVRTLDASFDVLARSPIRSVAVTPMWLLAAFADHFLGSSWQLDDVRARSRTLYGPVWRSLGFAPRRGERGDRRLFRADVFEHLAVTAEDPGLRREAARRARRFLGIGGRADPDALPPELVGTALTVAVRDGDAAFFETLLERAFSTDDPMMRSRLLRALTRVTDPALAARARDLALDPRLRTNEVLMPLFNQMREPRTREATWSWLGSHFDALVEHAPATRTGGLPALAASFCTVDRATEAERFFGAHLPGLEGAPRALRAATETIRLCAARLDRYRTEVGIQYTGVPPATCCSPDYGPEPGSTTP